VEPGGTVTALDPSRLLLNRLAQKCEERRVANVELVQGVAEALPFEDSHFDAVVAVLALHFTDVDRALGEMVRVAKPGGLVSALSPAPEFDIRKIPMVAMWFRPLSDLADRFGIPFAERNGLPVGVLQEAFARHLTNVSMRDIPAAVDAGDYRSFLAFVLRGAAFFQNILSRLPYQERWAIMARLEQTGAELVKSTAPEEQRALYSAEAAYGWKAPADQQDTNTSDL
jgi:SAM-dependent methyltransferase